MLINVFLRSTRRQPVRMVFLLLVTALTTFAFVARGAEYLVVKQETERLAGYYRSIGSVSAISGDIYKDSQEAVAYLEGEPLVKTVNTFKYVPAVIEDNICNVNTEPYGSYANAYFAFYGTLAKWDQREFHFLVDTIINGYPEWVNPERKEVVLSRTSGGLGASPIPGIEFNDWFITTAKTGDPDDVDAAYAALEQGQRYLVVAYYNQIAAPSMCRVTHDSEGENFTTYAIYSHPLTDRFFYPVPEGEADWSDPQLDEIRQHLKCIREVQHSLNVIPLQDMSALPLTRNTESGIYLIEGRWLDYQDDEQEKYVCVIGSTLASARKLTVGDTLTLKLQDAPSLFGIVEGAGWEMDPDSLKSVTATYEIVGIYDYLDAFNIYGKPNTDVQSFVYIPAFALPDDFQLDYSGQVFYEYMNDPYSSFPMRFQGTRSTLPYPESVSFELVSSSVESQFLEKAEPALAELGFMPQLAESGWGSFQSAAHPMRESSLYNVEIFSIVLLVTLGLTAFIYFFSRRREMQIVRDLGLPAPRAIRQASTPLLLIGFAAILTGGGAGWWYAGRSAEMLLSALPAVNDMEASTQLPTQWLVLFYGIPITLIAILAIGGAVYMAGRPLLLGQSGAKKHKSAKISFTAQEAQNAAINRSTQTVQVRSSTAPTSSDIPVRKSTTTTKITRKKPLLTMRFQLRFILRHVTRSWGKSLLSVGLSAVFTISLAGIQLSIINNRNEVDQLYKRTTVSVELVKADTTQITPAGAFIFEDTIETILETGFILDSHVEGSNYGVMFRYDETWEPGQSIFVKNQQMTNCTIRSIDSEEKFLSKSGSGQHAEIHYADGWNGSLFSEEWDTSSGGPFPMILPKESWDEYGLEGGELMGVACKSAIRMCKVAGYYSGEVGGEYGGLGQQNDYDESTPILMPTSALRTMLPNMLLQQGSLTVDPTQNQNLDGLRTVIEELANNKPRTGGVPVRIVLWDEELRMAVEPVEASIRLMQVLYPVTLVLSLLAAVGLAALLVILSSKEAAMMRVQGTTVTQIILMLSLQQIFTCIVGLAVGLFGTLLYIGSIKPELLTGIIPGAVICAALYLIAGVIGSVASSMAVMSKNPLEMLQVKE